MTVHDGANSPQYFQNLFPGATEISKFCAPLSLVAVAMFSLASDLLLPKPSYGDEPEYTLAPIVKDASPLDLLAHDPILPVEQGTPKIDTSSGSIQHSLSNDLPYSVTDEANPGSCPSFAA